MVVNFQIEREDFIYYFIVECEDDGERILCVNVEGEDGCIYVDNGEEVFNEKFVKNCDEYWRALEGVIYKLPPILPFKL